MKCNALLLCLIIGLGAGCVKPGRAQKPDQQSPLTSPSEKYVLTMPIEKDTTRRNFSYWHVTISDRDGKVVHKDTTSTFVGHLNVYWTWDQDDRVWLYNSDDGTVWFWEQADGAWTKNKYGYGRTKEIDREIAPPKKFYNNHVR